MKAQFAITKAMKTNKYFAGKCDLLISQMEVLNLSPEKKLIPDDIWVAYQKVIDRNHLLQRRGEKKSPVRLMYWLIQRLADCREQAALLNPAVENTVLSTARCLMGYYACKAGLLSWTRQLKRAS
jgi:hypothetical protein